METTCKCSEHQHKKEEGHLHLHRHETACEKENLKFCISVYCHESAVVGAVKGSVKEYYTDSVKILKEIMMKIAEDITLQGGTIGHIKSFLRSSEDSCMLSITDMEDGVVQSDKKERYTQFVCAAIVFGITEKQLYEIMTDSFERQL